MNNPKRILGYSMLFVALVILLIACIVADGAERPKAGIVIRNRPVIIITMTTGHVYTVWHRACLCDEWEPEFYMTRMVVSNKPRRIEMTLSEAKASEFFWLQIDGDTNMPPTLYGDDCDY
jgi:hypothetical protein